MSATIERRASVVGCYVLHLYCSLQCDRRLERAQRNEYTGATRLEAVAAARTDGWKIRGNDAVCPRCVLENKR